MRIEYGCPKAKGISLTHLLCFVDGHIHQCQKDSLIVVTCQLFDNLIRALSHSHFQQLFYLM